MNAGRQRGKVTEAKANMWRTQVTKRTEFIALSLLAAVVYFGMNFELLTYIAGNIDGRSALKSIALALYLILGFVGIVFGLAGLPAIIYRVALVIIFVSFTANIAVLLISKHVVTGPVVVWLMAESDNTWNALQEFWKEISISILLSCAAVLAIAFAQRRLSLQLGEYFRRGMHIKLRAAAMCVFWCLPVASALWPQNRALAETNIYSYGVLALSQSVPDPGKVEIANSNAPAADKIVIILDESIRPDVFKDEILRHHATDMVYIEDGFSTANCSAASNAYMRWGVARSDIQSRHDARSNPTIWAYARNAGFRTTLIEGQMSKATQNFIRKAELEEIDEYLPMESGIDTDSRIGHELVRRLQTKDRELIYIVKRGAHFPYGENIPANLRIAGASQLDDYHTAVRYSTGGFFDILLSKSVDLSKVIIFYTSDHGQYFGGGAFHCRGDYLADTYRVPVAVIGGNSAFLQSIERARECRSGPVSHQNIRTTLIEAIGYKKADLERDGFPTLTACMTQDQIPQFVGMLPFPTREGEIVSLVSWKP
jgi:glucan phosphoethanolaminetransferase (alkaline phosphatase superfamily)